MPRLVPIRLAAACALALISTLSLSATALAKPSAELRVVGGKGKVLGEGAVALGGKVSLKSSPKATCFGPGTGGSGKKTTLSGSSALGLLARGAQQTAALRPLLVTDHFLAEFGLGICSIGGTKATRSESWFIKVDHKVPSVGGEKVKVHSGDEVIWAFGGYPYPADLALETPSEVHAGVPFTVSVFAYDEKGKRKPASGATVTGASGPTDAAGKATVTLAAPALLSARLGKDIPSAGEPVCVDGTCPSASQ
jgi:hypothetical protein